LRCRSCANCHSRSGWLAETAVAADLPRQPGKVTVLDLDQGVVTQIRYAADAKALRLALGIEAE
jgi:hypothetical protein